MAKSAQEQYEFIGNELAARTGVKVSKMFGMPVLKINGKAFAGFSEGEMTFKLKLKSEEHAHALGLSGAHLFDPGMGRPMKEWVQVPVEHSAEWLDLAEKAMEYVSGLSA
jgi:hypothetical protein